MGRTRYQTIEEDQMVYYRIRKAIPEKGRKRFAITSHQKVDGKLKSSTVKSPELASINKYFADGIYDFDTAFAKCKVLLDSLYKERDRQYPTSTFNSANMKLFEKYWDDIFADRDHVSPKNMYLDLRRAVESVGMLSLVAASKEDLQKAINQRWADKPNNQRRTVSRLNPFLKYLGRNIKLRKVRPVKAPITHLTMAEFNKVYPHLRNPNFQILCGVAMTTGLRLGEIFALRPSDLIGNTLLVSSQVDRDFSLRDTKTRQVRKAYVLDEGVDWLQKWFCLSEDKKRGIRNIKHSLRLKKACLEEFTAPDKLCKFHDLRHSYAIHLLSKGVPIAQVARSLGNSVAVCEKHYVGYVLTDFGIELIDSILRKK